MLFTKKKKLDQDWKIKKQVKRKLRYTASPKTMRYKKFFIFKYLALMFYSFFTIKLYISKNNYRVFCFNQYGKYFFWFTLKQLGFERHHKNSQFVSEIIFDLILYNIRRIDKKFLTLQIFGKNFNIKWNLYRILREKKFFIINIKKNLFFPFNGCKLRHARRL
jgi:hypothetical protein